ncbi:Odorant receptor 13a [Anthophora quadrimaculata]
MKGRKEGGDFARLIGLNLDLLRLCGVIPCGTGFFGRNALGCVAFGCLTIYSISYTYQLIRPMDNLETISEMFTMFLAIVGGQARFSILSAFRATCQRMLKVCQFFWSTLKPQEKEIVESYAKIMKLLTRCYLATCAFTILSTCAFTMFDQTKYLHDSPESVTSPRSMLDGSSIVDNDTTIRRLPYPFFFEVQRTPWYELTYVLQLLTILNVGLACVAVDTTGPLLILLSCGHFDVIRSRIERLDAIDQPSSMGPFSTRETSSSVQTRNLRVLLIRHGMLLEFCNEIERIMNVIFLTQLLGSTYNISLVGFKLIGDNRNKYMHTSQLLIIVIQLFLCNWPADLLSSKSESIGRAAYTIPWHWYPRCLRKPTNMLMVRGQKPVRLTAGKFVGLSLETFASMISTALSFFTVIRSMN